MEAWIMARSASRDRRDEGHLVAGRQRLGQRRIDTIHCNGRLSRERVERGTSAAQVFDQVPDRRSIGELDVELGCAEKISVDRKEEGMNGQ